MVLPLGTQVPVTVGFGRCEYGSAAGRFFAGIAKRIELMVVSYKQILGDKRILSTVYDRARRIADIGQASTTIVDVTFGQAPNEKHILELRKSTQRTLLL